MHQGERCDFSVVPGSEEPGVDCPEYGCKTVFAQIRQTTELRNGDWCVKLPGQGGNDLIRMPVPLAAEQMEASCV